MTNITFITGNQNKADYLAKYLGHSVDHVKLDLDEIQSLDLKEIVEHKVRPTKRGYGCASVAVRAEKRAKKML